MLPRITSTGRRNSLGTTVFLCLSALLATLLVAASLAQAAETRLVATPVGAPMVAFDPKNDGCDGNDVPDAPLRAWRDEAGRVNAFGLHFDNRRLRGADLQTLTLDCAIVYRGSGNSDPKRYDDRAWITATYSLDGKRVFALAHHEFQAQAHPGRCTFKTYMECWWNTILALESRNGGAHFQKMAPAVIAATPHPSEQHQGRHRGFFNPSNIIAKDGAFYTLIGTTGWAGQKGGVCLFQTRDLANPASWRALSATGFDAAFPDPYASKPSAPGPACRTLAPFPAPVGSIARHRTSGVFIAIFQAAAGTPDGFGGSYGRSGFYTATSRDLITWSPPLLVMDTKTLYDDACGADVLNSYPVLIDPEAQTRNFEDLGTEVLLFYSRMRIAGCAHTGDRVLVRQRIRISAFRAE